MTTSQIELADPPQDGISSVHFCPSADGLLLTTSWDKSLRVYDVARNKLQSRLYLACPLLTGVFGADSQTAFCGGLTGELFVVDLKSVKIREAVAAHDAAIKSLCYLASEGILVSGSWDGWTKYWRLQTDGRLLQLAAMQHDGKISALDAGWDGHDEAASTRRILLVATIDRKIDILTLGYGSPTANPSTSNNVDGDTNHLVVAFKSRRETAMKFQTRAAALSPGHTSGLYVCASIEGRLSVEPLATDQQSQLHRYAFKSHRIRDDGTETIYPVNAVCFHPQLTDIFASGGSDGFVHLWNARLRKRCVSFGPFEAGVSALAFSPNGRHLAIASSYSYEQGPIDHPLDQLFIRTLDPGDLL